MSLDPYAVVLLVVLCTAIVCATVVCVVALLRADRAEIALVVRALPELAATLARRRRR
ncbi:hypothetical protein AB0E83_16720 [Streptomyces sp. NPDC035033]|uniref:hypothetical protein n=1 Tax=Streptomyces sp. NPDC035033 TaxID=3155368 RepID=UPI0033CE0C93